MDYIIRKSDFILKVWSDSSRNLKITCEFILMTWSAENKSDKSHEWQIFPLNKSNSEDSKRDSSGKISRSDLIFITWQRPLLIFPAIQYESRQEQAEIKYLNSDLISLQISRFIWAVQTDKYGYESMSELAEIKYFPIISIGRFTEIYFWFS